MVDRGKSGEHDHLPCRDHDSRLIRLESKAEYMDKETTSLRSICEDNAKRLHAGDLGFLSMRSDIQALAKAVQEAVDQMKAASSFDWASEAKRALVSWGIPAAIVAVVWIAVNSGIVPVNRAPDTPAKASP